MLPFFILNVIIFCYCSLSSVSLVRIIYQILFGFKVFECKHVTLLFIVVCVFKMHWNESFTRISIMDLTMIILQYRPE